MAASQRRLGRLMGYGALVDSGVALIALGIGSEQGVALALLGLLVRPFGLALMAAGLRGLEREQGYDLRLKTVRGLARRLPWSTCAFIVGGVSTAGLPVTAGFAGRWALYRVLGAPELTSVLAMMTASLGLMIGVWRALRALLAGSGGRVEMAEEEQGDATELWPKAVVVLLAVAASVAVGLVPQLLAPTATHLAGFYTFFAR